MASLITSHDNDLRNLRTRYVLLGNCQTCSMVRLPNNLCSAKAVIRLATRQIWFTRRHIVSRASRRNLVLYRTVAFSINALLWPTSDVMGMMVSAWVDRASGDVLATYCPSEQLKCHQGLVVRYLK